MYVFHKKELVGSDSLGNHYYKSGDKRFVKYSDGGNNPALISTEWHLWLHYAADKKSNPQKMMTAEHEASSVKKKQDYESWEPRFK